MKLGANITVNKSQCGLENVTNEQQIPLSQKGAVNGVPSLDANGQIPLAQMNPSFKAISVVADIAGRDAIAAEDRYSAMRVFVTDASGDATVTASNAVYLLDSDLTTWIKISEGESMDIDFSVFLNKTTDTLDDITDGSNSHHFTTALQAKLAAIEEAATANSTDAFLRDRANHTGTQLAATISDLTATVNGLIANAQKGYLPVYNDSSAIPSPPAGFVQKVYLLSDTQGEPDGEYVYDGTTLTALFEL